MKSGTIGIAAFRALVTTRKRPKAWESGQGIQRHYICCDRGNCRLSDCYWVLIPYRGPCRACYTAPFSGGIEPYNLVPAAMAPAKSHGEQMETENRAGISMFLRTGAKQVHPESPSTSGRCLPSTKGPRHQGPTLYTSLSLAAPHCKHHLPSVAPRAGKCVKSTSATLVDMWMDIRSSLDPVPKRNERSE